MFFFFNDTATTEIYTLSLHDALPIYRRRGGRGIARYAGPGRSSPNTRAWSASASCAAGAVARDGTGDRKSTRLNSSHVRISYAVFCLKKKNKRHHGTPPPDRRTEHMA